MKKSSKSKGGEPDFEAALAELEKTVADLESGRLGFDETLNRHARGVELLTRCRSLLDTAARRVSLLIGVDPSGLAETAPFDSPREDPAPVNFEDDEADDDLAPF